MGKLAEIVVVRAGVVGASRAARLARDGHGIDPRAETWVSGSGFSGQLLMQTPAVGRLIAEQIDAGRITSVDGEGLHLDSSAHVTGSQRVGLVV